MISLIPWKKGGYDLIFLDYNDGTDDIRRNAALLEEVIREVNAAKSTTVQNVVMGMSMGGLVARYALAEMTKAHEDPDTRLLITHDSPHRGANVPIGVQYLVLALVNDNFLPYGQKFTDYVPELTETAGLLDRPATQQLLLYRGQATRIFVPPLYSYFQYSVINNTFLNTTYRDMVTFSSSDPQPGYEMIATSDGAECGQGSLNPGDMIADIDGSISVKHSLGLKYKLSIQVKSLPSYGQTGQVLHIKFSCNRSLLIIPIKRTLFDLPLNATGLTPVDNMPGGLYSVNEFAPDLGTIHTVTDTSVLFFNISIHTDVTPTIQDFIFVPTTSALDIPYIPAGSPKFVNGILPFGDTSSFRSFIAQEPFTIDDGGTALTKYNQVHITFTGRNAQWIYDEMNDVPNTLNCSDNCTPEGELTIQGSETVCTSEEYSIPGIPENTTVEWSSTSSILTSLAPNGNKVTVTKDRSGLDTLIATVHSPCSTAPYVVTKAILVGNPYYYPNATYSTSYGASYPLLLSLHPWIIPNELCDSYGGFTQINLKNADNIVWSKVDQSAGATVTWNQAYGNISFWLSGQDESVAFQVDATNTCGTLSAIYRFKAVYCEGLPPQGNIITGNDQFSISPNPATNTISITSSAGTKSIKSNKVISAPTNGPASQIQVVKVYSIDGKLVMQKRFSKTTSQVNLNVSNLTNGTYLVEIINSKKQKEMHKVIINKY